MSSLEDLYGFCQFGGHSQRAPRKRRFKELSPILFVDNSDTYPCGLACNDCTKDIKTGDLTINVLYNWANERLASNTTNQLPDDDNSSLQIISRLRRYRTLYSIPLFLIQPFQRNF
jgi:hypothetical protein